MARMRITLTPSPSPARGRGVIRRVGVRVLKGVGYSLNAVQRRAGRDEHLGAGLPSRGGA